MTKTLIARHLGGSSVPHWHVSRLRHVPVKVVVSDQPRTHHRSLAVCPSDVLAPRLPDLTAQGARWVARPADLPGAAPAVRAIRFPSLNQRAF